MLFYVAFRNLFRNMRRSFAVVATIAFGVTALLCYEGFHYGVLEQYRDGTIHSHYGYGQINTAGYRETVYEKPWDHWIVDYPQLKKHLEAQEGVVSLFPRVGFSALLKHGNATLSGVGQGIDASKESQFFYSLRIEEGIPLLDQPDGIVLGKGLAHALGVHPGDNVTLMAQATDGQMNQADFRVVGIYNTGSQDFDSRTFRVPLERAQRLLKTPAVETVALGLRSTDDWKTIEQAVGSYSSHLEAVPFEVLDAIYYSHSIAWLDAQSKVIQSIILLIVILGIFNTVSTTLLERKQEIGNLRANGESKRGVLGLLLSEGALGGFLGALIGVALTLVIVHIIFPKGILMPPGPGLTREFRAMMKLHSGLILQTVALGVTAVSVATFFAALRVLRIPIARALRYH